MPLAAACRNRDHSCPSQLLDGERDRALRGDDPAVPIEDVDEDVPGAVGARADPDERHGHEVEDRGRPAHRPPQGCFVRDGGGLERVERAAAPRRVPRGELGRAGSRREALDRAADLDDGHARAGRGELPLDRGQRLAPGDAEHVVLAQETRQERSGGDRHVVDDERRRELVALLERTREAVVDASGLGDLEADDAFRPRLLQETHDLEPRHAEALGDVLLGQIADVVEPGDLGHLRSAHSCILLHR